MVRILDWKRSEDPRDVVHVVVQALAEGRLVLLPTETSYLLAAGGLNEAAVQRLMQFPGRIANQPLTLLLRSPDEVVDYATKMSPVAKRVAARGWPGPLALELPADPDESLFGRLPANVRSALNIEGGFVAMQVPAHQAVADALQFLPGPIVAAELDAGEGNPVCEPQLRSEQSGDPSLAFLVDDGRTHFGGSATHLRIDGSCCSVTRTGVLDKSVLVGLGQLTVLLVCTGNTCRSPMAETLLRAQLQQRFAKLFAPGAPTPAIAISAGLSAYPGGNASPEAMTVMQQRGLSLKDHQSRPITQRLLRQADLVLTMTASHRGAIIQRWPEASRKTFLLSNNGQDVADPYGGPTHVYSACADEIERFIVPWVSRIDESWLPFWSE